MEKIAPCSLLCFTCSAFEQGVISDLSTKLLYYLKGFNEFYAKNNPSKTEGLHILTEELENYSHGNCSGCRNREHHNCSINGCFILACTKEHNINFCGECKEFPCDRTKKIFEDEVYLQWMKGNEEIKDLGIEEFWEKNCMKPHYQSYKQK